MTGREVKVELKKIMAWVISCRKCGKIMKSFNKNQADAWAFTHQQTHR